MTTEKEYYVPDSRGPLTKRGRAEWRLRVEHVALGHPASMNGDPIDSVDVLRYALEAIADGRDAMERYLFIRGYGVPRSYMLLAERVAAVGLGRIAPDETWGAEKND